jgi:hypothetical protein
MGAYKIVSVENGREHLVYFGFATREQVQDILEEQCRENPDVDFRLVDLEKDLNENESGV